MRRFIVTLLLVTVRSGGGGGTTSQGSAGVYYIDCSVATNGNETNPSFSMEHFVQREWIHF